MPWVPWVPARRRRHQSATNISQTFVSPRCMHMCMDMYMELCTDVSVDMCIGMCKDMRIRSNVSQHTYSCVHRHIVPRSIAKLSAADKEQLTAAFHQACPLSRAVPPPRCRPCLPASPACLLARPPLLPCLSVNLPHTNLLLTELLCARARACVHTTCVCMRKPCCVGWCSWVPTARMTSLKMSCLPSERCQPAPTNFIAVGIVQQLA